MKPKMEPAFESSAGVRYATPGEASQREGKPLKRPHIIAAGLALVFGLALVLGPFITFASSAHHASMRGNDAHRQNTRQQGRRGHSGAIRLSAATTVLAYPPPPIQAKAAILVDMGTQRILFARNADARLPMASTTKITTAALVLALAHLGDMVAVSKKAATIGESTMSLQPGERLTVEQLLYGLLLNSGNDAAIALAEHVGGSEAHFVAMMNELAGTLGMTNTHYATPHGLDAPHHYTSARDLATISLYAMRDPTFRKIVATTSFHVLATKHNHEHWLASVNRVIFWYPGVDGVKPGDTDAAGLCQVVTAWRDGRHLLAVLLNTPTLVNDIRNLLDFGSRDFRWVQAPAWWDAPANTISDGAGAHAWSYYFGAGHYVRGPFLRYFRTHGGLGTLGFPRTEEINEAGQKVQFFQGAELIADPARESVYPADLGAAAARLLAPAATWPNARVTPGFAGAYKQFGGKGVLGLPVTGTTTVSGSTVQFFQYGAIVEFHGTPVLLPVGDLALRQLHWLPSAGAGDAYPPTLAPSLLAGR